MLDLGLRLRLRSQLKPEPGYSPLILIGLSVRFTAPPSFEVTKEATSFIRSFWIAGDMCSKGVSVTKIALYFDGCLH